MIVVTGAAGFIGSVLIGRLLADGYGEIVAVDDFSKPEKEPNLSEKKLLHKIDREEFPAWFEQNGERVQFLFHIGARTDTSEMREDVLEHLNVNYSKKLWNLCVRHSVPMIYASSAATYGSGSQGFDDNVAELHNLTPMNPYGYSKHRFDLWVQEQGDKPPFWAGFKFFNVYGPNEYHKERMASVVFHAFNQIGNQGYVNLFRSHREEYEDGEQLRDFIYVKDVADVMVHFMENRNYSDLYNLGTGNARSFHDLATAVFHALNQPVDIRFIDIPADIRETYQYFTCANMQKLRDAGYTRPFTTLEAGVNDYVKQFLQNSLNY